MKSRLPFLVALLLCLPQGADAFLFVIFQGLLDFICSLPFLNIFCGGGGPPFESKMYASGAEAGAAFGAAVDLKGDTAIVGAPGHLDKGAAYVYERQGPRWVERGQLQPTDLEEGDLLGTAVATDGQYLLVSAPLHGDENFGAVYLYGRDSSGGYVQERKFLAEDRTEDEFYGRAAALSNGRAVVAAPWANNETGALYVYRRFELFWFPEQKIEPSDGEEDDEFGSAVAIDGDLLVVGAPDKGGNVGAVYIYTRSDADGWVEEGKLFPDPPGPTIEPSFGFSVDVRGETIAVGTYPDEGQTAGSVYVFDRAPAQTGNWSQYVKIDASDIAGLNETDAFGRSVTLASENSMVVAAPIKGSAYVFSRIGSGWALEGIINPESVSDNGNGNPQLGIAFGFRIAGDGSQVVVGARLDDGPGATAEDAGAAFVYDLGQL